MNGFRSAPHRPWGALRCFCLAAFAGLLVLNGCRPPAPADLVIVNGNEPESLDPALVAAVPDIRIAKALFEGLAKTDGRTGGPVPALAERWDISPDGKTYRFHLRTNLVWSTGEPITASDVLYSWTRAISPETASDYAGQLFYIRDAEEFYTGKLSDPRRVGMRALDSHTFEVELNSPVAFFLDLCCLPVLAVVPKSAIEAHGDRWLTHRPLPVSGPYELAEWRLNDRVRLRKNPLYWNAAQTRSAVVDLLPAASPNTALNLFQTGVADVIWDKDLVPVELMDVLTKRPEFHNFTFLGTCFYRFNVTRKPLDDPRVRRAFALATDRVTILKKLALGGEKPAWHIVPSGVANYESPPGLPFDPEQARRLLADAGFPGGKGLRRLQYAFFGASGGAAQMQAKLAVELQACWQQELGVEVELRQIERKIFYSVLGRLDYDLASSSWLGDYNDANTFLDLFLSQGGNNRTGWKNERYDALLRDANGQTDRQRRAALLQDAERLLIAEEAPIVPLYFYAGFTYFDDRKVTGIYPNLLDEHPIQDIRKPGLVTGPPRRDGSNGH